MNRRHFMRRIAGGAALGTGLLVAPAAIAARRIHGSSFATPTFIAFLETILPGRENDPSGAPGALDAGTLAYFDELERLKLFPISLLLVHSALCHALNLLSALRHLRPFWGLPQEKREELLESLTGVVGLPFLFRLARAPFYVGAVNRAGLDWIGLRLPPPEGFSRESSSWGIELNQPEPGTIHGNLP